MADLPDLPPSKYHFWDGADKHYTEEKYRKCDHYFEGKGYSVECRRCHIGTMLSYPFYVLDGKICKDDEYVL